jgi:hypothetical protein
MIYQEAKSLSKNRFKNPVGNTEQVLEGTPYCQSHPVVKPLIALFREL